MSQHDMIIENAPGATVRADINNALQALASNSLGGTAPTTTYAGQTWLDSSGANPVYKIRNTANSQWLSAFSIDASGNLGIGTSSPNFNAGTGTVCHINNANAGAWSLSHYTTGTTGSTASDGFAVGYLNDGVDLINYENSAMRFWTNSTERMRIDSSGNLLVGTTTVQTGVTTDPVGISLYGSSANGTGIFTRSSPNPVLYINNKTANSGLIQFYNGGNSVGSITSNGTGTTYGTSSDYRLKENIQPMQNALATVAQLNPVTYTWKADGSDGQGFIAHELQAVVPDCVTGEKDAVDKDGNPVYQGIDTSFLVATLTKAIQELHSEVQSLKDELATLK